MKQAIYSIYTPIPGYRNKSKFELWIGDIKQSHQKYADDINCPYFLFDAVPDQNNEHTKSLSTYDAINMSKYTYAEKLLDEFDQVLYIDYDVIPNTCVNFFEAHNLEEYIAVKATTNRDVGHEYLKPYEDTMAALIRNKEQRELLERFDFLSDEYYKGITSESFHGIPWSNESRPNQFEEDLGINWFFQTNGLNINKIDHTWIEESSSGLMRGINSIQPWDDIVKYAAINIMTNKSTFYNTGVMGFSKNMFAKLSIWEHFDDVKHQMQNLNSSKWPNYVTKQIEFNNEILFTFKMITNNVPVYDIGDDWNYFVDWNTVLTSLDTFPPSKYNFKTCKFRHYLNKNFEREFSK